MTKEYATPEECASVTRQATPDENWLANQLDRIDPHRHEIGSAGDRPALERLVFELKAEVERLRKDAERWRTLAAMEAKRVAPDTLSHYIAHPGRLDYIASFEQLQIARAAMKGTP